VYNTANEMQPTNAKICSREGIALLKVVGKEEE
jgi:hypothetical protein